MSEEGQDPAELVEELRAAFAEGDRELLGTLLSDDFAWHVIDAEGAEQDFFDRAGDLFEALDGMCRSGEVILTCVIDDDDRIAETWQYTTSATWRAYAQRVGQGGEVGEGGENDGW
jgi:ketosteroid isomerase-like protein